VVLGLAAAAVAAFVVAGRGARSETSSIADVVTSAPAQAGTAVAEANLRSAIASMQAYRAINGTYAGASLPGSGVRVVRADAAGSGIEATAAGATTSARGPAGTVAAGPC